jgi:hypothetical protein
MADPHFRLTHPVAALIEEPGEGIRKAAADLLVQEDYSERKGLRPS